MQKGHQLQFQCTECQSLISFSLLNQLDQTIACKKCPKSFVFGKKITNQLKQFASLCQQIHASKDILGNACVGVDVGETQVKIPYKLLLTRFNSTLDLNLDGKNLSIQFRLEPIKEFAHEPA